MHAAKDRFILIRHTFQVFNSTMMSDKVCQKFDYNGQLLNHVDPVLLIKRHIGQMEIHFGW